MQYQKLFLFSLLLAVSQAPSGADSYRVDLYPPLEQIWTRLQAAKPLDPFKLVDSLIKFLVCIAPQPSTTTPNPTRTEIESVLMADPGAVGLPPYLQQWIKDYVKTAEFDQIHKFLWFVEPHEWSPSVEWNDLIYLLYARGFQGNPAKDIYALVKELYVGLEVPQHLIDELPIGPPTPISRTNNSNVVHHRDRRSLPLALETPKELLPFLALMQEETCNWEEIISDLLNALEWLGIVKFIGAEVKGNPSIHVLWAKIYEHKKGEAFRRFRELDATKCMEHYLMQGLDWNPLWQLVIGILTGLTGIDFGSLKINVVSNIISFAEYLVWRTTFPVPTDPTAAFFNEACTAGFNLTRVV